MAPIIRQMVIREGASDEVVFNYFTVGNRIGPKAVNDNWDVLLIQAMLRYLWAYERGTPDNLCPLPTGIYDKTTAGAIWNFQKKQNLEADWYIDPLPPHYRGIAVGSRHKVVWTMARLYILVMEKAVVEPVHLNPVMDVLERLRDRFPILTPVAAWMKDEAVGSNVF
ncbi:MAG TPA: peptidoglycan-binding domain-containing protein [Pyrinomonadaceae bacterium]